VAEKATWSSAVIATVSPVSATTALVRRRASRAARLSISPSTWHSASTLCDTGIVSTVTPLFLSTL
jgi:hypothetical protein